MHLFRNSLQTDDRWRQNVVKTRKWHTRTGECVTDVFQYHILTSSVFYWTDPRQHGIYLFYTMSRKEKRPIHIPTSYRLIACVAWRFCRAGRRSAPISSRFLYLRPPLLFSAPNQNRHATQANCLTVRGYVLVYAFFKSQKQLFVSASSFFVYPNCIQLISSKSLWKSFLAQSRIICESILQNSESLVAMTHDGNVLSRL